MSVVMALTPWLPVISIHLSRPCFTLPTDMQIMDQKWLYLQMLMQVEKMLPEAQP
jgi:hypothetical protein